MRQPDERMILSSGRRLGYARYGVAGGQPAFYFHGLPGSRREGALLDRACQEVGVELIAPDRPGYGLSDPASGDRLADWPAVILEMADRFGWERFHLFAISGGAPYALACAALASERVIATGIVGGLGDLTIPALRASLRGFARVGFQLTSLGPAWLKYSFGPVVVPAAKWLPGLGVRVQALLNIPPDRDVLLQPEIRALFTANLHAAFQQGTAGGLADMCTALHPWPFEPGRITDLFLWHGGEDRIVPPLHSETLARRVPAARLTVVPGEGHFSLPVRYARRIVTGVLGREADTAAG